MKNFDFSKGLFWFSCFFLAFAAGVRMAPTLGNSMVGLAVESVSLVVDEASVRVGWPVHYLRDAYYEGEGVTQFDADQASPGLTFLVGFFEDRNELRLVELDGTLVHSWPIRFYDIFGEFSHIQPPSEIPKTDWNIVIHGAQPLPDGSVVFNFSGKGLAKLNRCAVVEWTVPYMTHHSMEVAEDGGFWVPGRRYVDDVSAFPPLQVPYFEDTIMKVSSSGEVESELSVPQLLFDNGLQALLFADGKHKLGVPPDDFIDIFELVHLNDIEELDSAMARHFPSEFVAGDLLLSLRDLNLVMLVDPTTGKVKWHQTGPWIKQHDADFNPDGTISVFNNNVDNTARGSIFGGSNIVKIDPVSRRSEVIYGAGEGQKMFSIIRGKHQVIGANILISESESGRAIEVNREGEIVWEYINRYDEDQTTLLTEATRYPPDYFQVKDWTCQ